MKHNVVKHDASVGRWMCVLGGAGEVCVSPVSAELQSAPVVERRSGEEGRCPAAAAAPAEGETIVRMKAASPAGWDSVRMEGTERGNLFIVSLWLHCKPRCTYLSHNMAAILIDLFQRPLTCTSVHTCTFLKSI